jgi:hypothetical protein
MGAIEDVYADLDTDVSEEEFRAAVEEKVEQMGGLADEETAAMLIAHELNDGEVETISDIEAGMDEVKFLAKVRSVGELRTFERDGEDEDGRVINVELIDETGSVRAAFWDEQAVSIDEGQLEQGQVLRVKGRPKDGYNGLEVSVDKAEPDADATIDVDLGGTSTVDSLTMGQSDVDCTGLVLDTESVRTFDRDDGSEGQVRNVRIQDDTGDIRVALWGEKADIDVEPGDEVFVADAEIQDGWQDDLEASAGWGSTVVVLDDDATAGGGSSGTAGSGSAGLDAFAEGDGSGSGAASGETAGADSAGSNGGGAAAVTEAPESDGESVEFTGTVVQTGDPVILDDGEETVSVDTDEHVQLGQEVTVRGRRDGDRVDADDLF